MSQYLLKDAQSRNIIKDWLAESAREYASRSSYKWKDEDALCEMFFSTLSGTRETPAGRIDIDSYKIRGRGPNAPEKRSGADGIGLVCLCTPTTSLSGFFLFQAKKADSETSKLGAKAQCRTMLTRSAASILLTLLPDRAVVSGAMAVTAAEGSDSRLDQIPFTGFHNFVADQILRGIMMEPLEETAVDKLSDLVESPRLLVSIIAGRGRRAAGLEPILEQLEFDLERLSLEDE